MGRPEYWYRLTPGPVSEYKWWNMLVERNFNEIFQLVCSSEDFLFHQYPNTYKCYRAYGFQAAYIIKNGEIVLPSVSLLEKPPRKLLSPKWSVMRLLSGDYLFYEITQFEFERMPRYWWINKPLSNTSPWYAKWSLSFLLWPLFFSYWLRCQMIQRIEHWWTFFVWCWSPPVSMLWRFMWKSRLYFLVFLG